MSDEAPKALYQHCVAVYNEMLRTATVKQADDGSRMVVWEGMLTALITQKMNLSVPYYTKVTVALKRMGCIRQLKRGGGTAPSLWEIIEEPTEDVFNTAADSKLRRPTKDNLVQQQLNDLSRRVAKLETILENIIKEETSG